MGSQKDLLMREPGDKRLEDAQTEVVCWRCFSDDDLRDFVRAHGAPGCCTFCQRKRVVANFATVAEHILSSIQTRYADPVETYAWDSREGGFQGSSMSTSEMLDDEDIVESDSEIYDALIEILGGEDKLWCEADPFRGPRSEQLAHGWEAFSELVKTRRRFFFREHEPEDPGDVDAVQLLSAIERYIRSNQLFQTLAADHKLFRVRVVPRAAPAPVGARDFGPPPAALATQSNRMSPPGIAMLYASLEKHTARREVGSVKRGYVAYVGELELAAPARLIDLSGVRSVPGRYAENNQDRDELLFLRRFALEIARPIDRDDRIHIEYVPTQVVTEFLRMTFAPEVVGVLYRSTRRKGGLNVALFCGTEAMKMNNKTSDGWIRLVQSQRARGARA